MTIPLSVDFRITPNVVAPAGSALDANGLVLSNNELIRVGTVAEFTTAADIAALLGSESPEHLAAQLYFAGYDNSSVIPGKLLITRVITAPVAGYLLSGSMKGVNLSDLQTFNAAILSMKIDGAMVVSQTINLSSATSFSDIASKLEAGMGSSKVSVEWLPISSRFIFRSKTTGSSSSVAFAEAGGLSAALRLTLNTGASTSPGSAPVTMTDMMNNVINLSQDWALFSSLVELTDDQKQELCAWVSASNHRFGYVPHDPSQAATVANNAQCFMQKVVVANGYENVFPVYGSYLYAIPALAYAASLDFARTNGRVSYKFRDFPGLAPNVTDGQTYSALLSNGYNFYGSYSLNKTMAQYTSNGAITGKFEWLDTFMCQVWMNANLVGAFANLFTANQSYPFNAQGYAAVNAAVIDVAQQALNFGAIRKGVTLDAAQIRIINNTVGADISSSLYSDGWYLYIPPQPGSNRIERDLKGVIFYYVDGGLIQSIAMSSTAIL